jgi:hypothetical protein
METTASASMVIEFVNSCFLLVPGPSSPWNLHLLADELGTVFIRPCFDLDSQLLPTIEVLGLSHFKN